MNNLSLYGIKRKLLISIIMGILSLLFASYGIIAKMGNVTIDIPWSLLLPILAAMAFGWQYGLIAGLTGGALFPFLLWANNGWANVFTAIAFQCIYILCGLLFDLSYFKKIQKFYVRILFVIIASILLVSFYYIFQFNAALALNPSFWENNTIQKLPNGVLYSFAIKDSINIIILILISESLLRIPFVCKLLGLPAEKQMQANNKIFVVSILIALIIWGLFAGLSLALLSPKALNDEHNSLAFLVILFSGIFVSRILFYYSEIQFIIQDQLNISEKKYRELFNANKDGITIFHLDTNGKVSNFIEMNKSAGEMIGYSKNELLGMNPADVEVDVTDVKREQRIYDLQTNGFSCFETILRHKNGSHIPVEITVFVINYNNQSALMNIARDISERKLAEYELIKAKEKAEESEREMNRAQQITHVGSWYLDLETNKVTWTEELYKMYGFDPTLPVPHYTQHMKLFTPESWETLSTALSRTAESGIPYDLELRTIRVDKTKGWMWVRGEVRKDSKGRTIGLWGAAQDISERKKNEQELIVAKEKAEESDRLKTAFLTNMSHEIRTPMNGILGFADLLKEPDLSGDEQHAYIDIIAKSGKRMLNIINDIIDISKIEAGLMKIEMQESNINEQIEYIYTFFKPEVEAKGLKLFFKTELPEKEALITTDREKLYAILINLVKNAIKYTPSGSIEYGYVSTGSTTASESEVVERLVLSEVEVSRPPELEFYVKDTGIGIPKNRQQAIFERFVQADIDDEMARQGAGLGLAITKSYVEMLGGKIWVESEEGKGSCFYFTLPYYSKQLEVTHIIDDSPEIKSDLKSLRILIAEDDETSETLLSIMLVTYSKDILKVKNGIDAVEICRQNPDIDLIMMDIRMPELGGYEACRQIRQFNNDVIIIAQTAFGLAGDREKALEAGCNDYISKPIKKNDLLELMQKYFKK